MWKDLEHPRIDQEAVTQKAEADSLFQEVEAFNRSHNAFISSWHTSATEALQGSIICYYPLLPFSLVCY